MKTFIHSPICGLQSDNYISGRRVMIFTDKASRPSVPRKMLIRRQWPFRVELMMAPEAQFSFEPAITVRSLTKP